jgi:hypothetical protein
MVSRDVMHKGLNLIHSPGMLSVAEADFLYDTAAGLVVRSDGDMLRWVELGTWCGRSLWAAGCGLPSNSGIRGVDTFSGQLPLREGSEQIVQYAPGKLQEELACAVFRALQALQVQSGAGIGAGVEASLSHEAAKGFPDGSVDVLVVDAAHDYESVCRDLGAWLTRMRPGGLIIGHDYGGKFEGVTRAFDERFGDKCQRVPGTRFVRVQL